MYRNNTGTVVITDRLNIPCINNLALMLTAMKGLPWASFTDDSKVCPVGLSFSWLSKVKLSSAVHLLVSSSVVQPCSDLVQSKITFSVEPGLKALIATSFELDAKWLPWSILMSLESVIWEVCPAFSRKCFLGLSGCWLSKVELSFSGVDLFSEASPDCVVSLEKYLSVPSGLVTLRTRPCKLDAAVWIMLSINKSSCSSSMSIDSGEYPVPTVFWKK